MMVTTLRASDRGLGVTGLGVRGRGELPTAVCLLPTSEPHSPQNFAAWGKSRPQLAQRAATGVPHSRQNFTRSGLVWPQAVQFM